MTVLPGLGLQVSAVSRRFFRQKCQTRFVPTRAVQSVIIHEGLSKWNVHYYLGVVTSERSQVMSASDDKVGSKDSKQQQDDARIVVAFEVSLPEHAVRFQLTPDHAPTAEHSETRLSRSEC